MFVTEQTSNLGHYLIMTLQRTGNRLIHELSPYLLQHAYNPVDWYPWGEEALSRAKSENKPIVISIGYSACHWCHVMEKESFEDEDTARLMNEHFINIKIDREERPDLDHIYMEAVQLMTGSGGWPLNVFLTPDLKPFYGGTYFPPEAMYNRPSWKDVLYGVAKTFNENAGDVLKRAQELTVHMMQSNDYGSVQGGSANMPAYSEKSVHEIYANIQKLSDFTDGGFGKAPKFPQTFLIHYLLSYHHFTGNKAALDQACLSLDKMISGGIYDHIGGGFARYSTDNRWLVPHFEKMLYDNALLLMVLSEAWQVTHKETYKSVIEQTLAFLHRELLSPEGGFYSALDADSEGEEGRFYVWTFEEIKNLLENDAEIFCEFYDVSVNGNWEGKNILNTPASLENFALKKNLPAEFIGQMLENGRKILLEERGKRPRPLLDDKMLLGWNALMNTALCKVYAALGNEEVKALAVKNMAFLLSRYRDEQRGSFFHTYKSNQAKYPAFLDDNAYLIQALIHLQEITGDAKYLDDASSITTSVIEHFSDEESVLFYFTNREQTDVLLRKKEVYDAAVPSGNAVMAWNLNYLGIVYDNQDWRARVVKMLNGFTDATVRYPASFGVWADMVQKMVLGIQELVVMGENFGNLHKEILHIFIPHRILQVSEHENERFPFLIGKKSSNEPVVFLCKDYACQAPVTNINLLKLLFKNN